jgi:hypothetical protein
MCSLLVLLLVAVCCRDCALHNGAVVVTVCRILAVEVLCCKGCALQPRPIYVVGKVVDVVVVS